MTLTAKIPEWIKSEDNEEPEVNSENSKVKTLQDNLNNILKEIGAKDERDINEAVSRIQNTRDKNVGIAQAEVNTFTNGTDKYSVKIKKLTEKLTPKEGTVLTTEEKEKINQDILKLGQEKTKALEKAKANLVQVTKEEDAKVQKAYEKAQEAIKILEELANLKKVGDSEVTVTEKTEALADFTKYRKLFTDESIPIEKRLEYGENLEKIADENRDNSTIKDAYKMIETKIKALKSAHMSKNNSNNSSVQPSLTERQGSFGI